MRTHHQLVLDHKQSPACGGERNHDQRNGPPELFFRNAYNHRKDDRRNHQWRKLGEQLQTPGTRFNSSFLFAITPRSRNYDQHAVAQSPRKVGPCPLLVVTRGLIGKSRIENHRMDCEEPAHPQEECSLGSTGTQQTAHQKTQRNEPEEKNSSVQRANLHRLPRGLPARRHVDLRQLYGKRERADLRKVANPQPSESAVWVAW